MDELKPKRPRSPSYPVIDLEKAVQRAEVIYEKDGKHLAPVDTIIAHWGYSAKGGRALRQVAALKKFGLIEEEGSQADRQIKLTQLGLYIVVPDSPERAASLRKAALLPTIHKDLHDKYGDGLPSDSTVRWYLKTEREFMDKAAAELLAEYRATMRFAGLDTRARATRDGTSDFSPPENLRQVPDIASAFAVGKPKTAPSPPPSRDENSTLRGVTIPLPGTAWVKIEGEFPMTKESWDQLLAMLTAMKPGLTRGS